MELLNRTLCWYVIFEREAREQSYHSYESLNSRNTHSNTKPTQVQSKASERALGCARVEAYTVNLQYGLDEGWWMRIRTIALGISGNNTGSSNSLRSDATFTIV